MYFKEVYSHGGKISKTCFNVKSKETYIDSSVGCPSELKIDAGLN